MKGISCIPKWSSNKRPKVGREGFIPQRVYGMGVGSMIYEEEQLERMREYYANKPVSNDEIRQKENRIMEMLIKQMIDDYPLLDNPNYYDALGDHPTQINGVNY